MTTNKSDLDRLASDLSRWRNEADMTQQALADAVGAHITYIQKLESTSTKTKRKPAMDMLVHILGTLDERRRARGLDRIDFNYAFKLAGYPEIATPIEWVYLLQELNAMSTIDKEREGVSALAKKLIQKYRRGTDEAAKQHQDSSKGDSKNIEGAAKGAKKDQSRKPPHGGR
jgi:transcriptional regulator with XRE-family HTH domain